ncbi:uncharacterized protein [Rutidosis leptorrhynchoides]|uniref:uncharacterized protein n=1 Tax=Rutidosis leptorrhynchoides TaxID=125765 RepID=UPI003A9A5468
MTYGTTPDLFDEYIKIGEKTAALCFDNFCKCVFHLFAREYLRKPTAEDIAPLYNFHAQKHGLPGMLGSIDSLLHLDVNGHHYDRGYYLGDGIYPDWAMLVKAPHAPTDEPRKKFKRFQESARKDIERAFGVLHGRFAMLKTLARSLDFNKIRRHMACLVLHNMSQENNGFVIGRREERMIERIPPRRLERDLGIVMQGLRK